MRFNEVDFLELKKLRRPTNRNRAGNFSELAKIWAEKPARFRSLLKAVIFPEGQKFSAAFLRKIFEFSCLN
jgi:hypothetical protein